jgi:hypothetical protein
MRWKASCLEVHCAVALGAHHLRRLWQTEGAATTHRTWARGWQLVETEGGKPIGSAARAPLHRARHHQPGSRGVAVRATCEIPAFGAIKWERLASGEITVFTAVPTICSSSSPPGPHERCDGALGWCGASG